MTGAGNGDGAESDDGASGPRVASDGDEADDRPTNAPDRSAADDRTAHEADVSATDEPAVDQQPARGAGTASEPAEIPAEESPPVEPVPLGESQGLDPAVRYYWMVGGVFAAVPLTVLAGILAFAANEVVTPLPVVPIAVGAFLLGIVLGAVRSVLRYRSWSYVVREESLYLNRGVLTRVQTVVPYVRVQHIDTRRGAVERLFGLSSLVVYTAGSRGADVTVPGLTPDRASALQTRLKRLAIESEEEDAV